MTEDLKETDRIAGPEAWLTGPLPDVSLILTPAAHALLQAGRDIQAAASDLSVEEIWYKPRGAPSVAFHLRHIAGSIDRLLTYAHGQQLSELQLQALAKESFRDEIADQADSLVRRATEGIENALRVLRSTPAASLTQSRQVGRRKLPSTVFGLLFHIAEHTQRHTGQIVTTARIVRGMSPPEESSS